MEITNDINKISTTTLIFFACYFALQKYIHLLFPFPQCSKPKLLSKYVSFLHGLMVAVSATCYLLSFCSIEFMLWLQYFIIGYCIYDTILGFGVTELYISETRTCMPIHHFTLAFFAYCVFPSYPTEVSIGYLAEWCNPLLHASYHMIHTPHGEYKTFLKCLKILSVVSIFFLRICNFTYLAWLSWVEGHYLTMMGVFLLDILNMYWFSKIQRLAWT